MRGGMGEGISEQLPADRGSERSSPPSPKRPPTLNASPLLPELVRLMKGRMRIFSLGYLQATAINMLLLEGGGGHQHLN